MSGQRIIRMTNQGIFFNEKECIPYTDTNLPKEHFTFTERIPIYWLADLNIDYRNDRRVIVVRVNDYGYNKIETFNDQVRKGEITFLMFENLDFNSFFASCICYQANRFKGLFSNYPKRTSPRPVDDMSTAKSPAAPKPYNLPIILEDSVEFKISFSDATIIDGGIQFTKKIEEIDLSIEFTISNTFLKASYEPIKEYFAKKLGRKTFSVKARIKRVDWKVVEAYANSKEIDRIDETFLHTIKYNQINSLLKIAKKTDIRQLYSIDELLKQSAEVQGNIFQTNINDIIQVLTIEFTHRNSKQLSYLAKNHNADEEVIHLTLSPFFGFVFCLLSNDDRCYIWELLDTHATYIWSFKRDICTKKLAFDLLEESINQIRRVGRIVYKKEYRKGLVNKEYLFQAMEHSIDGGVTTVFEEWLAKLRAIIGQNE